jgi:ATP-dependent Clp protease protease subunit
MSKEQSGRLADVGIHILIGEITDSSCKDAISFILEKNIDTTKTRPKEIHLIINSMGGSVTAAFSLIDIMLGSTIPIVTTGIGQIASCGLLIFMTGNKRVLTPNTSILSHQYSWGACGKQHDLIAIRKEEDLIAERIVNHYKMCTKMSNKKLAKVLGPSDMWLTAEEAKEYNFCDEIKLYSNNG